MRILIVDDNFISQAKLESLLSAYGQIEKAENGDQALEMFKAAHKESEPYDLITMDVNMPGINGHEVVAKIREWEVSNTVYMERAEASILMITAMQSRTDVLSSFRVGCEGYVKKPIKPENLAEALEKIGIASPASSSNQ